MNGLLAAVRRYPAESALLALGIALRLAFFDSKSLWWDETTNLLVLQGPFSEHLRLLRALDLTPPLHTLALRPWMPLFGDPVLGMRLFSVLCGAASLVVFRGICRRLVPGSTSLALALACLSSCWIHYAQDGKAYALFLLLSLVQTRFALELRDRWMGRGLALYGLTAVLGVHTHLFFCFQLLAHFVYLAWGGWKRRDRVWALLAVHALALASLAPWLAYMTGRFTLAGHVYSEAFTLPILLRTFGAMLIDPSFLALAIDRWIQAAGLAVLLGLALGAARWRRGAAVPEGAGSSPLAGGGWRRHPPEGAVFCAAHLGVALGAVWVAEVLYGQPLVQNRYLVFASPFLYLLLAVLMGEMRGWASAALRGVLGTVMAAGSLLYFVSTVYLDPHLGALCSRLTERLDRRTPFFYPEPFHYLPMRYYYLPERSHYMLEGPGLNIDWDRVPGYPPRVSKERLERLPDCLVFDMGRRLSAKPLWIASGKKIARLLGGPGP
ncbi:MAG: glycosyltransferase family 39 protein [Elusimicrobia bacterium]|nr:glycosyltransferase family 39 protein [Elusimicrobiota bacterium]